MKKILKPKNKNYYAKDGLMITALSWISLSIFGALPFYLSGEISTCNKSKIEGAQIVLTIGDSLAGGFDADAGAYRHRARRCSGVSPLADAPLEVVVCARSVPACQGGTHRHVPQRRNLRARYVLL